MTMHSLAIIPLSLSKLFERLAFYGMRGILILYLINQMAYEHSHASSIYTIFVLACGLFPILGGVLGDLLLSTKLTAIIGGFIQALGFFVLAYPAQAGIYIGLGLVAFGSGLYSPNIISTLSSVYTNRIEKLDAAILILYLTVNIGAFLGSFVIGSTSDYVGYKIGFIVCGFIMIGAQLILLLSNSLLKDAPTSPNIRVEDHKQGGTSATNILIVISTIFSISIFWVIYELSNNPIFDRISEIENQFSAFYSTFYSLSTISLIFIGIILIIVYSFIRMSSLLKIAIGFVIYALTCIIIWVCCKQEVSSSFIIIILFTVILQSIAELFVSPTALSLICKYGSTKFNSTLLGTYTAFSSLLSYFSASLMIHSYTNSTIILIISVVLLTIFAAIFLVFFIVTKQDKAVL